MDVFAIDWETKRRKTIAFHLNLLFLLPVEKWDAVKDISILSESEVLSAIEFLASIINQKQSEIEVAKAIGILTRALSEEGHTYLFGAVVERVSNLGHYFDRNKIRYPLGRVNRMLCILNALINFRSPVAVTSIEYFFQNLIAPKVDSPSDLRERLKLEATRPLCMLLKYHEEHYRTYATQSDDALKCLLKMALHPCLHISTLGYCTLLLLASSARRRFNRIPEVLESIGTSDDSWQEPGVGNQRIALLLNGKLFAQYIPRLIDECMAEIEA